MASGDSASAASADGSDPSNADQVSATQGTIQNSENILSVIVSHKKHVDVDRCILVKKRMDENKLKLSGVTNNLYNLAQSRRDCTDKEAVADLLTKRQDDALCMLRGFDLSNGDKDNGGCQEDISCASSTILLGNNCGGKNVIRPIKLQGVPKLPPYTTWIFLDRNQRMAEDQSVVGRRRIYYDQNGGEALICSDSEEEIVEDEEEKKDFGTCEDYILRMTIDEVGLSDAVLNSIGQYLERKPCEIKARYESILAKERIESYVEKDDNGTLPNKDSFVDKDLDAALDSFDNLFCRRCLVFDCRLHGCSQDLVFPAEKQFPWSNVDEDVPCGSHCHRSVPKLEPITSVISSMPLLSEEMQSPSSGSAGAQKSSKKKVSGLSTGRRRKSNQSESASSNAKIASESSESEIRPRQHNISTSLAISPSKSKVIGKCGVRKRNNKRVAERVLVCIRKKQRKMTLSDSDSVVSGCNSPREMKLRPNLCRDKTDATSGQGCLKSPTVRKSQRREPPILGDRDSSPTENHHETLDEKSQELPVVDANDSLGEFVDENYKQGITDDKCWKAIEKGLFAKGLEIFGKNSCLIARNLLNGMKTCAEVSQYINLIESKLSTRTGDGASQVEGIFQVDYNNPLGTELRTRSRFFRRRGRVRRLKYTWKSAGYHFIRKRITERKDQPCRQYTPCNCQSACGKQCPCLLNGTCCEKYCGCFKICKNRFRGCHCAKSQCRSRQCPCFAADRECDPDVCRNCWVGCGDGSLGGPTQRGDNYECRNMKLLLKQQQRVLLGRSDVSGWGAFLKNGVNKHEYLGEYTGELISHREADKRGKIYDRENSSFLFNLNDQFVLDAYRKGDKLKFANHSPDPNCYAKVIMVAGDHRVGIYAKEKIGAGEELFYDYRYEADRAPAWARKPEASGAKKDDSVPSCGRAKKLA
ncbi:Histone-lysine N-methyltransferase EZ1 [Acorus calamus]|uniref:Histone-lysine N-methyltransferase EZ1 n=1 Tax=Acorus calamus TaxID=4465 RepID=A0AAV9EY45_ACOCL|nr:Histone-lysine N-methyltransferase EZ1 [Acorus calamus]